MADSIILNKSNSIEKCLLRIEEYYAGHENDFEKDLMRQDAVLLNLRRACEQSLDLANHLIRKLKLGVPKNSRHSIEILENEHIITPELSIKMMNMVGFSNIAVHEYSKLDLKVVRGILDNHLCDFREFVKVALNYI